MHFTGTVYRNPYWPTFPLLQITQECHKLDEAGVAYWMTFLNGVAGKEHSRDHAVHLSLIHI